MSVDYYSCKCCHDARYEEAIITCEKCGASICDKCVVLDPKKDNDCDWYFPDYVKTDEGKLKSKYCPYCSGKVIDDKDLLKFIYDKYSIDEKTIKKEFLKQRGEK
jgi:hypothetical protein